MTKQDDRRLYLKFVLFEIRTSKTPVCLDLCLVLRNPLVLLLEWLIKFVTLKLWHRYIHYLLDSSVCPLCPRWVSNRSCPLVMVGITPRSTSSTSVFDGSDTQRIEEDRRVGVRHGHRGQQVWVGFRSTVPSDPLRRTDPYPTPTSHPHRVYTVSHNLPLVT